METCLSRSTLLLSTLALLSAAGCSTPSDADLGGLGQVHQEFWAVTHCWADLRDGRVSSLEGCSDYARSHLDFFTDALAPDAATTTCLLSKQHLAYGRKNDPKATDLLLSLTSEMQANCGHPEVNRTWVMQHPPTQP